MDQTDKKEKTASGQPLLEIEATKEPAVVDSKNSGSQSVKTDLREQAPKKEDKAKTSTEEKEKKQKKAAEPQEKKMDDFKVGDTIKVGVKVKEGEKERIQFFEGVVIAKRGRGQNKTFTVRRIGSGGVGIERIWLLGSPIIHSLKVTKKGKFTKAKLYYLRKRVGKAALRVRAFQETPV